MSFLTGNQPLPYLTVDAIIGNQALVKVDVIHALDYNKIRQKTFFGIFLERTKLKPKLSFVFII